MKAIVQKGKGMVEVVDKPVPDLRPGEALIKVEYCGIGPIDVRTYQSSETSDMILGHEYSGTIAQLGPSTDRWHRGQRVASNKVMQCGHCRFCQEGRDNICEENLVLGISVDGTLAEYVRVPASSLHEVPHDITMEQAAMAELVAVSLHAVKLADLQFKDRIVVQGAGAMGLITLDLARAHGVKNMIVTDINSARLTIAREKGDVTALNPNETDLCSKVEEMTAGYGADIVFDCAGTPESVSKSLEVIRAGGTVVLLRHCDKPVQVDFSKLHEKEVAIKMSHYSTEWEFEEALAYLEAGDVTPEKYISKVISMEEAAEFGFKDMEKGGSNLKVLVKL